MHLAYNTFQFVVFIRCASQAPTNITNYMSYGPKKKKKVDVLSVSALPKFRNSRGVGWGKDRISHEKRRWSCFLKERREMPFPKHREARKESDLAGIKWDANVTRAFIPFV